MIVLAGGVHCAGSSAFDPLIDTMNAAPTRRPITKDRPCLIRDMLFSRLRGRLIRPYGRQRRWAGPGLAGARAPPVENPPAEARSEEHTSALQPLMRTSYAVICLTKNTTHTR